MQTEAEKKALSRAEITKLMIEAWQPEQKEECILLTEAEGRILSRDTVAVHSLPVFRSSAMDGIAVRSADFSDGKMPDTENWQYGTDYVRADTGDDFLDAFDTVIPIEEVELLENGVRITSDPAEIVKGKFVRPCGSMVKKDELIVPKGYCITPYRMASLATGGVKEVWVSKRPVVTFLPTGSELIPAGEIPARGQNIESNSLMVGSLVRGWGAEYRCMPIVRDQMTQLRDALTEAVEQSDIVLINGGSSKGSEDLSIPLLQEMGQVLQHYVRSAPGRPMSVSLVGQTLVINVPGPTLAAFAVCDWAVKPAVYCYQGYAEQNESETMAVLEEDLNSPPFMEIYTRVILTKKDGQWYAKPIGRSASMEEGAGKCNGILVTELGRKGYKAGETVKIKNING